MMTLPGQSILALSHHKLDLSPEAMERLQASAAASNGRLPQARTLMRWIREGRGPEVRALLAARQLALTYFRIEDSMPGGISYNEFKLEAAVRRYLKGYVRLYDFLVENELPVVAFLRSQIETMGKGVGIYGLSTPAALKRYKRWVERQRAKHWLPLEQDKAEVRLDRLKEPRAWVTACIKGDLEYIRWVKRTTPFQADEPELFVWLEQHSLSGPYLALQPVIRDWYDSKRLCSSVTDKVRRALNLFESNPPLLSLAQDLLNDGLHDRSLPV